MVKTKLRVRIETFEPMLGMMPADPEILREHIGKKAVAKHPELEEEIFDEVNSLPKVEGEVERKTTVYPREDGRPFYWDYQIKGFFKDVCGMLWRTENSKSKKLKAYRKMIDGLLFVFPRKIPIKIPADTEITIKERPLRANTSKGERVSIARSETIAAGAIIEFEVVLLTDKLMDALVEWLDYGELRGLGGWRNASWGRFHYEILNGDEQK